MTATHEGCWLCLIIRHRGVPGDSVRVTPWKQGESWAGRSRNGELAGHRTAGDNGSRPFDDAHPFRYEGDSGSPPRRGAGRLSAEHALAAALPSAFGVYESPERALVFDVNDFDETLPGPWEWDVKRLAASFVIAARHNEFDSSDDRDLPGRAVAGYRDAMRKFATMRYLDVWYAHLDVEAIHNALADQLTKKARKRGAKFIRKSRSKNTLHAFDELTEQTKDGYRIASQPPLIIPFREILHHEGPEQIETTARREFEAYLASVPDHIGVLLHRYRDLAIKVVGVGSVGTRCLVVLLQGRDEHHLFFLQIKEADRSVLEDHLPAASTKRTDDGSSRVND